MANVNTHIDTHTHARARVKRHLVAIVGVNSDYPIASSDGEDIPVRGVGTTEHLHPYWGLVRARALGSRKRRLLRLMPCSAFRLYRLSVQKLIDVGVFSSDSGTENGRGSGSGWIYSDMGRLIATRARSQRSYM